MSLSYETALLRFLARCPDLRSNPKFVNLAQKGRVLSADDVVAVVADPFLHPNYTIPVMGCFRPLCRQLMQRAVAKLFSVPSTELESGGDGEEIGKEDMHVIDFYVGRGRGLRLHELACLAFCRALDLAPFLLTITGMLLEAVIVADQLWFRIPSDCVQGDIGGICSFWLFYAYFFFHP